MQDSIELPSQQYDQQIANLNSPFAKSRQKSPQSLAYSGCNNLVKIATMRRDVIGTIISNQKVPLFLKEGESPPPQLHIVENKAESPDRLKNIQIQEERIARKNQYKRISPNTKTVSQKQKPKLNKHEGRNKTQQQQRKTIDKSEQVNLRKRNHELQYNLQLQNVISEELRAKVNVLSQLLETKFKDNHSLAALLNMKNSSKEVKNIDLFVELKVRQKALSQAEVRNNRLRDHNKNLSQQNQKLKSKLIETKKENKSLNQSPQNSMEESQLKVQFEKLLEEKQSLFNFIEEQSALLSKKTSYAEQLQYQIKRLIEKQGFLKQQREMFIRQVEQKKQKIKINEESLQKLNMEARLTEISHIGMIEQLQKDKFLMQKMIFEKEQELKSIGTMKKVQKSEEYAQTNNLENQILIKELLLLKNERDYYLSQYRQKVKQSSQFYTFLTKDKIDKKQLIR